MKWVDRYTVGVVAFAALVLFLVVAMFIGPGPKLEGSPAIKNYAVELDQLVMTAEAENRRIKAELPTIDCPALAELSTRLHREAAGLQTEAIANLVVALEREGLLDRLQQGVLAGLPDSVDQNFARIGQLAGERSDLIQQRLTECLE